MTQRCGSRPSFIRTMLTMYRIKLASARTEIARVVIVLCLRGKGVVKMGGYLLARLWWSRDAACLRQGRMLALRLRRIRDADVLY